MVTYDQVEHIARDVECESKCEPSNACTDVFDGHEQDDSSDADQKRGQERIADRDPSICRP